jgi:hypothetical protein
MADTSTITGPFTGLYNFFANDPSGGALSYPAMEARRKIALQLVASNAKKGYPKTFGEGLSAIGDAIGERGLMRQLAAQEAAYQKKAEQAGAAAIPGEAQIKPPVQQRSEAVEEPTTLEADTTAVPVPERTADASERPVYPQTAAMQTGVVSDAPPVGVSPASLAAAAPPRRDAIASLLLNGSEVPQVNPTLSGAMPPATSPATGGPPPDTQIAQTQAARTPGNVTDINAAPVLPGIKVAPPARPLPPAPPVNIPEPSPRIPLPTDVPMTEDEKRGYRLRSQALSLGDPYMKEQADGLIRYGAEQRKQQYDAVLKDYQDQMLARRQKQQTEEQFAREAPERGVRIAKEQEQLVAAQKANQLREQFGNMPPDEVFKRVTASQQEARSAARGLQASDAAMDAFGKGAITGFGADAKLNVAKLFSSLGLVDKGNVIANTETFRAAMQPVIAAILHQTSGTSQLSEGELYFARQAAAGNISLDPQSITQLMSIIDKRSREILKDHQTTMDALFPNNPQAKATFGVEHPDVPVNVNSEAEANKLPVGTKVRINGRKGVVR